jgi:AmmeMemoRadiSam system protein A
MFHPARLTEPDRGELLALARKTLEHVVRHRILPEVHPADLRDALRRVAACFVSLTHHDSLRGCIGHLIARDPLYRSVIENTRSAAVTDPRFPPLQAAELGGVRIEISVLTSLQPLSYSSPAELPGLLRPHQDGVVLHLGDQLTTFLPQVWDQIPDPEEFLDRLARKAGGDPNAWRQAQARISIYEAQVFAEST